MAMTRDMTTGSEARHLIGFTLPLLAGNLLQQTYNVADTMIVGKYLGDDSLAAVGATGSITYLFYTLCIGLSLGAGILISQLFGARLRNKVRTAIVGSAAVTAIFGAVISILSVFLARPVLTALSVPDNLLSRSVTYMRIACAGTLCVAAYNWINAVMRALGDSKTPLIFLGVSTALNVGLDLLFVVCFKMGVGGAAFATVLSQGVSAVSCIIFCFKKNKDIRPRKDELRPQPAVMKKVIRIGLPIAAQNGLVSISMVALQRVTNGFGKTVMASYTVSMRIEQFIQQPFSSLSAAISTFAGQNIGASQEKRAQNGLKVSVRIGIIFAFAVFAVYLVCADLIVGCFVSKKAVISIGAKALIMTGCFYAPLSLIHTVRGFLNGAGDVSFALINGLTEVVCRVGLSLILTNISGISYWGIWITTSATWVATAAVCVIRYRKGKWKLKALT